MKKPKSFLPAVGEANPGRVTRLNLDGRAYFAPYGEPTEAIAGAPPSPERVPAAASRVEAHTR
jgi:hypothetical protein